MLFLKIKYITLIKIQDHNRSYTEHADANLHSSLQSKGLKYGSLKVWELYIQVFAMLLFWKVSLMPK